MEPSKTLAVASLTVVMLILAGSISAQQSSSQRAGAAGVSRAAHSRVVTQFNRRRLQDGHPWIHSFGSFMEEYEKDYETVDEARNRFSIFIANVQHIEAHNKKKLSYKLGINEFADLTFEEFKNARLMQIPQDCSATTGNHVKSTNVALPEKVDWRNKNIVSPVKDQRKCGSCWSFSATGAMEAALAQATGHNVSLSEQQLVDCAQAYNNNGCKGGLPSQAFEYIKYNGGLDTEASYPYQALDGQCHYNPSNVGARVYEVVNITMGNEKELKDAVAYQRPVSVAFEVLEDFMFYKSGVYSSNACQSGPTTVNHAVLAVGYVAKKGRTPYWIVKNSWGEDWGVQGYFHIEQGKDMCGIASCASYPVVALC